MTNDKTIMTEEFKMTGYLKLTSASLVVAVVILLAGPFAGRAADTNSVLDAWFAAQGRVQTWSADFIQIRQFKAVTQPFTNSGRIYFSMTNDFRWELGRPAQTIALRHGDEMFLVYPALKRAERYPMGAAAPRQFRDMMSLLQAGLPRNRQAFESQFQILSMVQDNDLWRLRLQPKSPGARQMLPELRISLRADGFSLADTTLVVADGSVIETIYSNETVNPALDKDLFEWKPPADFKVADPNKH